MLSKPDYTLERCTLRWHHMKHKSIHLTPVNRRHCSSAIALTMSASVTASMAFATGRCSAGRVACSVV